MANSTRASLALALASLLAGKLRERLQSKKGYLIDVVCDLILDTNPQKSHPSRKTPIMQHPQIKAGSRAKARLWDGDIADLR